MEQNLEADVVRFAAEAVEQLADRPGGALDFSQGSLEVIEQILAEAAEYREELSESVVRTLVERIGCYVLEVGHRQFGGKYFWHDSDQPVLVVGEPAFHVALTAWGKVQSRILGDAADNIPFHYQGFAERALKAEPGSKALFV